MEISTPTRTIRITRYINQSAGPFQLMKVSPASAGIETSVKIKVKSIV